MTRRFRIGMVGAILASSLAAACWTGCRRNEDPGEDSKAIKLLFSIALPPAHPQCVAAMNWAREIEKRAGDRVRIKVYPGGSLTRADFCFEGVIKGASDIGLSSFAETRELFPLLEGLDLPLGCPNGATATRVAHELAQKYKPKELRDVHLLYVHASGPSILASRRPVRTLDDFKGLKVRANGLAAQIAESLGATPVTLRSSETYEALAKGTVEATLGLTETLKDLKQGEAIQYVVEAPAVGCTTAMFVVMNKRKWNKLPSDLQELFSKVSQEWVAKHGAAWDQAEQEARTYLGELKRDLITLPEAEQDRWKSAVRPVIDRYLRSTKEKGLPGAALLQDIQAQIVKAASAGK